MKASNRFKQNPILPFLTPDRKIPVKAMSLSKQIDVTNHYEGNTFDCQIATVSRWYCPFAFQVQRVQIHRCKYDK